MRGEENSMGKRFLKFADLPPNPMSESDLQAYRELGFDVCLLTEDNVKLVKNGKLNEEYIQAIRNIEKNGMNVWIRNMYNDEDYFQCVSGKEGSNYGTPYEMESRDITTEFREFPNVTGFYMADEPYMYTLPQEIPIAWMRKDAYKFAAFDKLVKLVDWKNEHYPDAFWHMNHVPSQSWDHYLPKNGKVYSYEDFLNAYVEIILKRLKGCNRSLSVDNYPLVGSDYIEKDYLYDLLTASKVTKEYNSQVNEEDKATFGICIQTFHVRAMAADDLRNRDIISTEEITFQIYTGMATGARMFEYFCYHGFEDTNGIMNKDGSKRIHHLVKAANERIQDIEQTIFDYEHLGTFVVPGSKISENVAAFVIAKDLFYQDQHIRVEAECDTVVGCFEKEGQKGYLLVNYTDPIRNHSSEISVRCAGGETIRVTLQPGGAAFITE